MDLKSLKAKLFLTGLVLLTILFISGGFVMAVDRADITIVTEIASHGQVVTALVLEYSDTLDPAHLSTDLYEVKANRVNEDGGELLGRTITAVYTNNEPSIALEANPGRYVIIELDADDINAPTLYYKETAIGGFNFNYEIEYIISQKNNIKTKDGTIIPAGVILGNKRKNLIVDEFQNFIYQDETREEMPYSLYIPANYDPDISYPLVLFLHGAGERGFNNQVHLKANMGAIVWAEDKVQSKYSAFVLAPQAPQNSGWTQFISIEDLYNPTKHLEMAYDLLHEIINAYNIDEDRLYSTGLSMGGFGTWAINIANPDTFAAMVPICGGGDPDKAHLLVNKAIWNFHAEDDATVPVELSRNIVNSLKELGSDIRYTEYESGFVSPPLALMPHFSWIPAYNNSEMIEWLFSQSK
ncbi:prolyl oligopeptidase family serine peptidase [Natronospora cellulosivora (SeqCode)]